MSNATQLILSAGAVVTALTAIAIAWRKASRVAREGRKDVRAFKDAILGRDEIVHPETGKVLAPAVPGIGARMATIETAVVEMANTHLRVDRLEERVSTLEAKDMERALARAESIELMRTIESALNSTPEARK